MIDGSTPRWEQVVCRYGRSGPWPQRIKRGSPRGNEGGACGGLESEATGRYHVMLIVRWGGAWKWRTLISPLRSVPPESWNF